MKEIIKDVLLQELVGHLLLAGSKQKPVILCPQKQGGMHGLQLQVLTLKKARRICCKQGSVW